MTHRYSICLAALMLCTAQRSHYVCEQTVQVTNTMVNLMHDLVYFHRFEKKKRKHNIPKHFHFMA
jgi:hypothetical protein